MKSYRLHKNKEMGRGCNDKPGVKKREAKKEMIRNSRRRNRNN